MSPASILDFCWDLIKGVATALAVPAHTEDPTSWRRSLRALALASTGVAIALLLWAAGILQHIGVDGPAYADDIDQKIEDAIRPLAAEQTEIKAKVDSTDLRTIAILRGLYSERIRTKVRQRCETADRDEVEDLNQQIDRIKREFHDLSGEDYGPSPRCDEV